MTFIDLLRKLGIFRAGTFKGTYTSGKDMPPELLMNDVINAKKDLTTKEDLKEIFGRKKKAAAASTCAQCGRGLAAGANFCANCGTPVTTAEPSAAAEEPSPTGPSRRAEVVPIRAKKKMGKGKKILLGAIATIAFIITLALWLTSDLLVPIEKQLEALRGGDLHTAYQQTSLTFQQVTSLDAFSRFVQAYPGLARNKESSFSERNFENNLGYVKGTLTARDGSVLPIEYQLVKENDAWKIQGINIPNVGQ